MSHLKIDFHAAEIELLFKTINMQKNNINRNTCIQC